VMSRHAWGAGRRGGAPRAGSRGEESAGPCAGWVWTFFSSAAWRILSAMPPFALVPGVNALLVVLVVVAGIVAEMAGALGPLFKAQRNYAGPLGKSDRAFAFGLLAVLLGIGLVPSLWTTLYLAALLVLSALTIVNRARRIVADAKGRAA